MRSRPTVLFAKAQLELFLHPKRPAANENRMEESRTNEIRNLSNAVERLVGHWQSVRSPTYTLHFYYSPVVNGVGRIYAVQDFSGELRFTLQGNYQIVAQDKESVTIKVTDDSDQAHESVRQLLVPADGQSLRLQVFGGDVHEYVDGDYNPPPSNVPPPKEPLGPIDVPPFKLAIVEQSRMKHAGQSFDWYELDTAFVESGKLPDLRGAQLSSFVLARLRNLIPDIPAESYEENDGGGFVFDLDVERDGEVVASIQLQGDSISPIVLGHGPQDVGDALQEVFVAKLLEAPDKLGECCYRIRNPEWDQSPELYTPTPTPDSINEYGWSKTTGFLGENNVKEED